MTNLSIAILASAVVLPLLSQACSVVAGNPSKPKPDVPNDNGTVRVVLFDAPTDSAQSVVVRISGLSLRKIPKRPTKADALCAEKPKDVRNLQEICAEDTSPQVYNFEQVQSIDLLKLQAGSTHTLVSDWKIPQGQYSQLSLLLEKNTRPKMILKSGETEEIFLTRGLKNLVDLDQWTFDQQAETFEINIDGTFDVLKDQTSNFFAHVNLREAIKRVADFTADSREIERLERLGFTKIMWADQRFFDPKTNQIVVGKEFDQNLQLVCAIPYDNATPPVETTGDGSPTAAPDFRLPNLTLAAKDCKTGAQPDLVQRSGYAKAGSFLLSINWNLGMPVALVGIFPNGEFEIIKEKLIFNKHGTVRISPTTEIYEDTWNPEIEKAGFFGP